MVHQRSDGPKRLSSWLSFTTGIVPKRQELPFPTKCHCTIKDVNNKVFEKSSKRKSVDSFSHWYYKYFRLELGWFWDKDIREMSACCQGLVWGVFFEILRCLCKGMFRWFFIVDTIKFCTSSKFWILCWASIFIFDIFIHVFKIFSSYLTCLFFKKNDH